MANELGKRIRQRHDDLMEFRRTWEHLWEECIRYVNPHRGDFVTHQSKGRHRTDHLYDATGPYANQQLGAGLHSFLTSPVEMWFSLGAKDLPEEDREAEAWMKFADEILYERYFLEEETGFVQAIHEVYLDLGALGTAVMYTEDIAGKPFRYRSIHLGECAIAENDQGDVDTLSRCYKRTYRQLLERFGSEALPRRMHDLGKTNPNRMYELIHIVGPREFLDIETGLPFASVFIDKEDSHALAVEGYHEFPYQAPRWSRTAGELYGRSPGMLVLPDLKMVNAMMQTTLKSGQKAVDPPIQMPAEGFLMPANFNPAAINYYEAGTQDRIEPIVQGGRPDIGMEIVSTTRDQILRAFHTDLLQLREGPEMTATEVLQRTEDRMRLMAPTISRIQRELLSPLVFRTLMVAIRRGDIPTPPKSLQGQSLQVSYTSPFVKAQEATKLFNYQRFMDSMIGLLSIKPEAVDNLNADETMRWAHGVVDAPSEILNSRQVVEQLRAARQQQLEEEQAKQDAERLVEAQSKLPQPGA